jgi:DNA-binding winged helix-turn-helix (wHTH) protein
VLRRQDQPVVITAKIFEVLVLLVQHRGRVVTKDELLSTLWPDTTVEDANLAQSISVLRKILDDSPKEHRYIVTVPGRGYSFTAPVVESPLQNRSGPESNPAMASAAHRSRSYYVSRAVVTVLLLAITGYFAFQKPSPSIFYSSRPVTSYQGSQICPTFAPDGERVAFAWDGESQDNFDIYVRQVGVALPLRLTNGPEPDVSPAWSPDGRTIAFLHVIAQGQAEVLLISAIAPGPARKLRTVTMPLESYFHLRFMAWSPDGRWIALSNGPHFTGVMSLVLLSVETGECRRVTFPPVDYDDFSPAFSPDICLSTPVLS